MEWEKRALRCTMVCQMNQFCSIAGLMCDCSFVKGVNDQREDQTLHYCFLISHQQLLLQIYKSQNCKLNTKPELIWLPKLDTYSEIKQWQNYKIKSKRHKHHLWPFLTDFRSLCYPKRPNNQNTLKIFSTHLQLTYSLEVLNILNIFYLLWSKSKTLL